MIAGNTQTDFTFTVSGLGNVITDVDLKFSATHSAITDLNVYLTSPEGIQINVIWGVGNNEDAGFQDTVLDDDAGTGRIGDAGFNEPFFVGLR